MPEAQRGQIAIQVLNGGAPSGSAGELTEQLQAAGFEPVTASDAIEPVDATIIFYAPGQLGPALTANEIVQANPERVVEGSGDNANWRAFGVELDVLVIIAVTTS